FWSQNLVYASERERLALKDHLLDIGLPATLGEFDANLVARTALRTKCLVLDSLIADQRATQEKMPLERKKQMDQWRTARRYLAKLELAPEASATERARAR